LKNVIGSVYFIALVMGIIVGVYYVGVDSQR